MIRRYARFVGFLVTAVTGTAVLWQPLGAVPAILAGFDAGVLIFFASLVSLFRAATAGEMRARSQANEPDHHLLLLLALAIAGVIIMAVWTEMIAISGQHDSNKGVILALAMLSLALAWLFANALCAIHYAHCWYLPGVDGGDAAGLNFPGSETQPDYWDFTYYTVTLSMTFQVSDVRIESQSLRRLAIAHGLIAFLFNISVIALSVSLVTSILAK